MPNPTSTSGHDINVEKLLNTFLELVRIDSPSGEEDELRLELLTRLKKMDLDDVVSTHTDNEGNLIVRIEGNTDYVLAITAHMDVVPPCIGVSPQVEGEGLDRIIRSDGTTVLGGDDKTPLAAMLIATEMSLTHSLPRPTLLYLLTVKEELNLSGALAMPREHYQDADFLMAFDTTGPQGTIVHEQPWYIKYKIQVHGRSSHAGVSPEKGINAITILGEILADIPQGRLDENTTTNIGLIGGGRAVNVVPDEAWAEGEFRSHHYETLLSEINEIQLVIKAARERHPEAVIEFDAPVCFEHYCTPLDHPAMQQIQTIMRDLNLDVQVSRNNGASDANVFINRGIPSGIVLSAGYVAPHTKDEHVFLRDMVTMTQLLLNTFETFSTWKKPTYEQ